MPVRRKLNFDQQKLAPGVFVIGDTAVIKGPIQYNEYNFLLTLSKTGLTPSPMFSYSKKLLLPDVTNTGQHFIDPNSQEYCYVTTPYFQQGDLLNWLNNNPEPTFLQDVVFVGRMLCIVQELHRFGLLHLDISLENIFVSDQNVLMISDGGHARKLNEWKYPTICGRRDYLDPSYGFWPSENLLPAYFDPHMPDTFALGVTILRYVTRSDCFHGTSNDPIYMYLLENGASKFLDWINTFQGDQIHPIFLQVIQSLIEPDYRKRFDITTVINRFLKDSKDF